MAKSPASSIRVLWSALFVGSMLGGSLIAQSSASPPKGNNQPIAQSILFNPIHPQSASKTVSLEVAASSGLPVTFRSTTRSICTVNKSVVSLRRAGVCVVEALQAGSQYYAAAPTVTQSFAVKFASQCCGLFDIAQDGTIVQSANKVKKSRFCPTPTLDPESPLSPDTWFPGATVQITVKGAGFTTAADATKACPSPVITAVMNDTSIPVSNITVVDSTTIRATVKVHADLPGAAVNIYLWGPDPSKKDDSTGAPADSKQ